MSRETPKPMYHDVLARVRQAVAELEGIDESAVREESRLSEDLGMDSLSRVELQMTLEDAFDVEMDERQAASIETVQQAAAAVCSALRV